MRKSREGVGRGMENNQHKTIIHFFTLRDIIKQRRKESYESISIIVKVKHNSEKNENKHIPLIGGWIDKWASLVAQ